MDAELTALLREQADIMRPRPERDAVFAAVEEWINANDLDLDLAGVVRLTLQVAVNAGWVPPQVCHHCNGVGAHHDTVGGPMCSDCLTMCVD